MTGDNDGEMNKGQNAKGLPAKLWSLELVLRTPCVEPLNLGIDKEVSEWQG